MALMACNNETKNQNENSNETEALDPALINDPTNPDDVSQSQDLPVLAFETERYEFPAPIKEGEKVKYSFKFTNTGKSDLIISEVNPVCGCTVPDFSKEPIPPGGKGKIDVEFNSDGRPGLNDKAVNVVSNSVPRVREIRFLVNVDPKTPAQP